ncbi:MAG: hypothetical protein N0A24_08830 [Armatimonadetes bacterium]|nr:hypothetical protein [Armatimonadota bacterium]MDW8154293.1 hypothetical protein [Armatimonadota bacterium]
MRKNTAVVLILCLALAAGGTIAYAQDITSLIKVIGVGAAVRMFGPQINDFINGLLLSRDAATQQTTKVVPILSVSIGLNAPGRATIGAAQVAGPAAAVRRVQAVAAVDANYQGVFQIRALIPVDSLEPWRHLRRVVGVGVSAIIDIQI